MLVCLYFWTVLNCLLGRNFTNITCISSNSGGGEYCVFSMLRARTTNIVVGLWPFPRPQLPACRCQPLHLPVLVDCFGDALGVRIPSHSLMEWINEENLKEFVCGVFTNPVRTQFRCGSRTVGSVCSG